MIDRFFIGPTEQSSYKSIDQFSYAKLAPNRDTQVCILAQSFSCFTAFLDEHEFWLVMREGPIVAPYPRAYTTDKSELPSQTMFRSEDHARMDSLPNAANTLQSARQRFQFINKTASSASLSHSEGSERIKLFSTAQRTSRKSLKERDGHVVQFQTASGSRYLLSSSYDSSKKSKRRSKSLGIAQFQAVPVTLPSATVNRIQLTAHFFASYYPVCMPGQTKVIDRLRQWMEPTRGALAFAAADSMILLHAAQTVGCEVLRKEGMLRYHRALQLLSDKLQSTDSACDDTVLGAVDIMGVVETRLLKSSNEDFEITKRAHTRGLYALILARGPSIVRSNVGKNILLQHLHEFLMVSLLSRKASVFGTSDWQAAFQSIGYTCRIHQLTALGCCIPQAFEKADTLINNKASTSVQYMELLTELGRLEDCLSNWLLNRYRELECRKTYWTTTASQSPLFHDQPVALQECYAFPDVVEHCSFMDALAHINCWALTLMLRRTILNVVTAQEAADLSSATSGRSIHNVRASCNEVADLICQSTCDFHRLPKHQSMIAKQGILAFLMVAILPWYSYAQDEEKIRWCYILLKAFQDEHTDLDLPETVQHTWTTRLYIGWVNMAF